MIDFYIIYFVCNFYYNNWLYLQSYNINFLIKNEYTNFLPIKEKFDDLLNRMNRAIVENQ